MDFAENVLSSQGEELQSDYFNKNYVTLHPLVVHYKKNTHNKDDEEDIRCRSYIGILDDRSHNASTIFAILQHFTPILKQDLPNSRYILYITDSPTSQYSNVSITTTLLKHETDASHGRRLCRRLFQVGPWRYH